ncbi:hypothetical protein BDK51DRAFT_33522, partial [Blyttiomyces helicus]
YAASRFAATLRRQLFREHLGLFPPQPVETHTVSMRPPPHPQEEHLGPDDDAVADPLSNDFYHGLWKATARANTEIFREVFHCVPDDTVRSWDDYKAFFPEFAVPGHPPDDKATPASLARVAQVRGHLVEFPLAFLVNEDLLDDKLSTELLNDATMKLYL